ncbi:MAG: TetR/AcrR family transcriptional regulator [Acidobacteria bacterium]|nr:TetR/AcrR family transcriptional regulator [Acidobacteriota bacterium]
MAEEIQARRSAVLESALRTFARSGYRATSMGDVARRAQISRPGLYLYFPSKAELFRAAVEHALARDVARCEALLGDSSMALRERIEGAFDLWSGQYVGPLADDLEGLLQRDAALLEDIPQRYSARFASALTGALRSAPAGALSVDRVSEDWTLDLLLSLATGLKHRATDPGDFSARMSRALAIVLR